MRFSKYTNKLLTEPRLMGNKGLFGGVAPFDNEVYTTSLQNIQNWLVQKRQYPVGDPPAPPGADAEDWARREYETNSPWHQRGLSDPRSRGWIEDALTDYGLDVMLRIPALPLSENTEERRNQLFSWTSDFWSNYDWNLIKINIEPGPLWIDFIASDFSIGDNHYHISLCYRRELGDWWALKGYDMTVMNEWINHYENMKRHYDGKRARIKGHRTSGYTIELRGETRVEGLNEPYILWDGVKGFSCWEDEGRMWVDDPVRDPGDNDVFFVHTLPGNNFKDKIQEDVDRCITENQTKGPGESRAQSSISSGYKSLQNMHVSMLLGD